MHSDHHDRAVRAGEYTTLEDAAVHLTREPGAYTLRRAGADKAFIRYQGLSSWTVLTALRHAEYGWRVTLAESAGAGCASPLDAEFARPGTPWPVPGGGAEPEEPRPRCDGSVAYDYKSVAGFPSIAAAVRDLDRKGSSFTVRRIDGRTAIVRERRGDRLIAYDVTRDAHGWRARGATIGPVGCEPLEEEFALPGEAIDLRGRT